MMRAIAIGLLLIIALPAPVQAELSAAPQQLADVVEKLTPAVVNISTTKEMKVQGMQQFKGFEGLPPGHPFEEFNDFFDRFMGPLPNNRKATSLGSGFVIDPEGYIVTNNHVIDGADEIIVTFGDDGEYKAKLIGSDAKTDLAVLKVDAGKDLPYVEFGDSDNSRVGDWVVVIGNPFGLGGTVTTGIISARSRDINAGPFDDFIQTDAAINRGNSGGPMFNLDGKVIGINTAIYSPGGLGNIGIGFAVPSSLARPIIEQLKNTGTIHRGWLGVKIQEVTDEIAESIGMKNARGALVAEVIKDSPAAKAGVKVGDIITEFDGRKVSEMKRLPRIVADTKIGKTVEIKVLREDGPKMLTVRVDELKESELVDEETDQSPSIASNVDKLVLGMILEKIDDEIRNQYGLEPSVNGLIVSDLQVNSPAFSRGIRKGDIILEINRDPAKNAQQMRDAVAKAIEQKRESILLLISRAGESLFLALPVKEEE